MKRILILNQEKMKNLVQEFNVAQKVVMVVMVFAALAMAYAYATGQLTEFTFKN